MTHVRQLCVVLLFALASAASGRAFAEPPEAAEQKPVRKLGGGEGSKVELAPAPQPNVPPAMDMPANSREALKEAREKAHAAMKEAHEAMQRVPKDTRAALDQAREAMKDAREQAREAMAKVPEEARAEMRDARQEMNKAREQGRDALDQAKVAMDKAREQMKQAMPGLPSTESRKDQARYARRVAWHNLMNRVARPSDISPPARAELRHHAMRMAKLQRIHALAAAKADKATMARCDKLLVREQTRHQAKLAQLLPQGQAAAKPAPDTDDEDQNEAEGPGEEDQEVEP